MNKVIAAVGLTVLSAASVQAQDTSGLTPSSQNTKDWSVAASLRGFYDDNYLTQPATIVVGGVSVRPRVASWGTEIIPSAAWNHSSENTTTETISYVYDLRWYENHSTTDQSHQLNMGLQHEFSDQYKISLNESFVIAQEPTVIDPSVISSPLRVEGNNLRNTGQINFTDSLTKDIDLQLGYANTLYDYPQLADSVIGYPFTGVESTYAPEPSRSALLNRMEQLATLDLRWKMTPDTTAVFGYQYGLTWYTSPEYIIYPYGGAPGDLGYKIPPGGTASAGYRSKIRDSDSHFLFVGADETLTPTLNASVRAGAEYLDYYNYDTSRLSPYVDASLTDQYQPGDSAQVGVKHVHNSTDVAGVGADLGNGGSAPVLDEESTAIYISDTHRLTERLTATIMGQAQISSFVGGGPGYDGKLDQFFILQVNFAYHFTPWFSTEAGYNYNRLKSDLPDRAYTRNFMYVGLRATY